MIAPPEDPLAAGWLAALPAEQRLRLYDQGVVHHYRAGSTLFHEGDPSDWVLLVLAGRIKITVLTSDGRDVVLAVRVPGELIGELSALDGLPRSATATAIETVECWIIPADQFREFLAS